MTVMLQSHGLSSKDSQSVIEFVESSHYQLACQKYFEITHKVSPSLGLHHDDVTMILQCVMFHYICLGQ